MGLSLGYIKSRIASGNTGLSDLKFDSMFELDTTSLINNANTLVGGLDVKSNDGILIAKIHYDDNADFNYFSMSRCICDGTYLFAVDTAREVLLRVLTCQTYNVDILQEPVLKTFNDYYMRYTIGNIIVCTEHSDEFAPKDKKWMRERVTALLPIKFELIKKRIKKGE